MENTYYCERCKKSLITPPTIFLLSEYVKLKLCDPCFRIKIKERRIKIKEQDKKNKNDKLAKFIMGLIILLIIIIIILLLIFGADKIAGIIVFSILAIWIILALLT